MTERFLRAAGYFRVSDREQAGERNVSLDVQRERFQTVCRERRFVSVGEYVDVYTGRKDSRKQYQKLLTAIRGREVEAIVVQYLDRFGRNPREILRRWWELEELHVERIVTDEDVKEELVLLIRAGLAGKESEKTAMRVTAAMERLARDGRWPGMAPFGFRLIQDPHAPDFGKLVVNERAAEIVRRMFRLYASGRCGFLSIARQFNAERLPSPRSGLWWGGMVQKMLHNAAYSGRLVWKGITLPGGCPALIEPELWQAVQQRLATRSVGWSRQPAPTPFLLLGLVRCGCGGNRHAWTDAFDRRRPLLRRDGSARVHRRYYRCGRTRSTGTCDLRDIRADRLERWVLDQVCQWTLPDATIDGGDDSARHVQIERERARLRGVIERAERRRQANYDNLNDRIIDRAAFSANEVRYRAEIAASEVELGRLREERPRLAHLDVLRTLSDFQRRLAHLTTEEQRSELAMFVERVEVCGPTPADWRIVPIPELAECVPQ